MSSNRSLWLQLSDRINTHFSGESGVSQLNVFVGIVLQNIHWNELEGSEKFTQPRYKHGNSVTK